MTTQRPFEKGVSYVLRANLYPPISEQAAELFYGRLFELDPAQEPLIKGDMKAQGAKLMTVIRTAVHGLSNLEAIVLAG